MPGFHPLWVIHYDTLTYDIYRPVARICFGGVRNFCQDFFWGGA